jgi:long-chain acyl-CoA synthetase
VEHISEAGPTTPSGQWSPSVGDLPTSVLRPIVRNLLLRPWRTFVVDDWRNWRGLELYAAAIVLSKEIERRSKSPRIGVMLPTSGLFPVALLASWLAGRTVVPVNYLLKPRERDAILSDANLDVVVSVSPMIEQFGDLPPGIRTILLDQLHFPRLPRFRRLPNEDPDATSVVMYSSGTSGEPKGVELTARNLAANTWQCARWGEVTQRDVFLGVLPQFHSFGLTVLTLLPLSVGAKVVYTARFVPRKLFELFQKHRATGFVGIPAMYEGLLTDKKATPADCSSARLMICAGEPLPTGLSRRFEERFRVAINEGYGLTETGPAANWMRPADMTPGSAGRPLPLVEEKIVDGAGQRVATGQEGEICIRGPNVMKGYFKRPEMTAVVFDTEGYFHTGDLGRIDDRGRLYVTGRMSDLIIVAGENVFPREIEEVLNQHPLVVDSAVLGIPNRLRGQVPVAFVELAEGAQFDEAGLRAHCRGLLASHKVPRRIVAVKELPRTPTGKVLKRLLPVEELRRPRREGPSQQETGGVGPQ